jgi:RES domain-containing protein
LGFVSLPAGNDDAELRDALNGFPRESFAGEVWRVVPEGRDPLEASPSGARWDPGRFNVLYTSMERDGAIAEGPEPSPAAPAILHRIAVRVRRALVLSDLAALERLGVGADDFKGGEQTRTQRIGAAAHALDFDAMIVPSERADCRNLVLFTDRLGPEDLVVEMREPVRA